MSRAPDKTLPDITARIFAQHGAIVEAGDDGAIEFLAPSFLAMRLGVPEHGKLTFVRNPSADSMLYASYDSELFRSLEGLLTESGRCASVRFLPEAPLPNAERLVPVLAERTLFSNAVFRYETMERKGVPYFLVYFKYAALSEDKREGVFALLINGLNFAVTVMREETGAILERLRDDEGTAYAEHAYQQTAEILERTARAAKRVARLELDNFVQSLQKAILRDTRRIYEYYEALSQETKTLIEKRALSQKDEGSAERLKAKLDAIALEREWKIRDLTSKYSVTIQVAPVAALRILAETPVLWIRIRRRLSSRLFPVTYNPLLRRFDNLPCESCFYPEGNLYVCDDQLHVVCARCFPQCPQCKKTHCAACHGNGCPRCTKRKQAWGTD